jgi:CBS domain-containing protein
MICPYCDQENIDGVDCCDNCQQDLTSFDLPTGRSKLERRIMTAPVSRLGPRTPVIVPADATVGTAVDALCRHHIGCVLVGSVEQLEGIFSERDVLLRIAGRFEELASAPVAEFMTRDPSRLDADAPIAYALNRMSNGDFRHLPITQDGRLVGIISLRDVLDFLSEWYPDLLPPQQGDAWSRSVATRMKQREARRAR